MRTGRFILVGIEVLFLSVLILATRCSNYPKVFVASNVYFTDADCYARMSRVQMCAAQPGLIVRHHNFENFPQGTSPHTTAPLDYLILSLAIFLRPFTSHAIDLAGALVSPVLALAGSWFLWWWSRTFRYRWPMLILYSISPILVHGTELGRPDHQSLLMLLVMVALCLEGSSWSGTTCESRTRAETSITGDDGIRESRMPSLRLSVVKGLAWGAALWVSLYELLLLLGIVVATSAIRRLSVQKSASTNAFGNIFDANLRAALVALGTVVVFAVVIERRVPLLSIFYSDPIFNWSGTIGELSSVSPLNPIWFRWAGCLIAIAPFLVWLRFRQRRNKANAVTMPTAIFVLLPASYLLTIWQARWAYFFVLILTIALPSLLEPIKSRFVVWLVFVLSIFSVLRDWDERLWPNDAELARRAERRMESIQVRELAIMMRSPQTHPFLAPWWVSPEISYWSGQPGVAGSSHESLPGIADSARFYLSEEPESAREILRDRQVEWVFACDSDRVIQNSAALLGMGAPAQSMCRILDRTPAQAPAFFMLTAQNGGGKLFRVNKR